jgi:hypothetical protein
MAIRQRCSVTIAFAGAGAASAGAPAGGAGKTRDVRVVESRAEQPRRFSVHDGDAPAYALSAEESAQLHHLLGRIEGRVPWRERVGLDGVDCELTLRGTMSCLTFRWWMEVPAEWEHVGAVFDYVLRVADARRAGGS